MLESILKFLTRRVALLSAVHVVGCCFLSNNLGRLEILNNDVVCLDFSLDSFKTLRPEGLLGVEPYLAVLFAQTWSLRGLLVQKQLVPRRVGLNHMAAVSNGVSCVVRSEAGLVTTSRVTRIACCTRSSVRSSLSVGMVL